MNTDAPQTIDHYEILEIIGHGGMSTVYRARDTHLERLVALKLMHTHLADKPDFQRRFLAEGRAIAGLDHPNIIKIHEVAFRERRLFLVMEHVEGGTLRSRLEEQMNLNHALEMREVVAMTRQVAQALQYAHDQGIIHRDVKPDNVLLKPDSEGTVTTLGFRALLSDFGLAKRIDGSGPMTATGELLGTLTYMAPEQFRDNAIDHRIDIYALGVMLYELATGKPPFNSTSMVDMILMHTQGEPERLQDLRPDVPPALISIVHRAMMKNPDDRYFTAGEIARELEALEKSIRPLTGYSRSWIVKRQVDEVDGNATVFDVLPALDRPPIPVDLLSEGSDDNIIVSPLDAPPWRLPFEKPSLSIGRSTTSDIVLDDPRVSRQHARIDRLPDGRILVADQGSFNGLFIGDEKLEKNMMMEWHSSESIKIGPFWLTLRLAKSPIGIGRRLALSAPRATETRIAGQDATVRLTPAEAVVDPGAVVIARIELINNSDKSSSYVINIQGLPLDWFTIAPFPLYAAQSLRAERSITFHPPRIPSSTAMTYEYVIAVAPKDNDRHITTLSGTLHVVQYYDFEYTLETNPQGFHVHITNKGNSQRYYVIEVRERDNTLIMLPARVRILIQAGQTAVTTVKVRGKRRPTIGRSRKQPVEVFIRTDGLRPVTTTYEHPLRPMIPWEMVVLFFLVLGMGLILITGR
jgi:eukaryotic-like serine/threonine-protein kinase